MYKDHLYLVNSEGDERETALHGTLLYIVTIYDVITKTARVLCRTYSCPYCIVYICGEWVVYAELVTIILGLRICMMPHAAPCQCACG